MAIISDSNSAKYSQEDTRELLHLFIDKLNKKSIIPVNVFVYTDNKIEQHKKDIQKEIDSIYLSRGNRYEPLTDDEIQVIRDLLNDGYSKSVISKAMNISRNTVIKHLK